ncbi:fimbrial protein [Xenorhabdus koppenhoeferi]|uniref:Pilin (Type 1 fimbria component protein) n=1 Tax=Xenorhabdus koppenhoeferi TaxID=351659 RepID=A0A1I7EYF7_9GAMM|nr:fimbrial protein [Xenorhabdus koppenhoeferi]SFU28925.1 Pilin (type 1 fimbria component protein) [Xenorhabdus koppenhoeferi]
MTGNTEGIQCAKSMISELMMKKLYQLFLPVIFLGGIFCSTGAEADNSFTCNGMAVDDDKVREVDLSQVVFLSDTQEGQVLFKGNTTLSGLPGLNDNDQLSYSFSKNLSGNSGITMAVVDDNDTSLSPNTSHITPSTGVTFKFLRGSNLMAGKLTGASLPQLCIHSANKANKARIKFTGTVKIRESTCTTPDVRVEMGDYDIADFKRKDSFTNWKNIGTGIVLNNCPDNTNLSITVLASNSVVNGGAQGIMEIDSSGGAAKGIGIQLQYDDNNFVKFGQPHQLTNSVSKGVITIPLQARYIQTENHVTPGKANGKVTYTMSYY